MRVSAFVDGLNLYHGMEAADLLKYRWLDIWGLCEHLVVDATANAEPPFSSDLELQDVTYALC